MPRFELDEEAAAEWVPALLADEYPFLKPGAAYHPAIADRDMALVTVHIIGHAQNNDVIRDLGNPDIDPLLGFEFAADPVDFAYWWGLVIPCTSATLTTQPAEFGQVGNPDAVDDRVAAVLAVLKEAVDAGNQLDAVLTSIASAQ